LAWLQRGSPLIVAVLAPWLIVLVGWLLQSMGARWGVYSADIVVLFGIGLAPTLTGLSRAWLRAWSRVAWSIGVGALVAGVGTSAGMTGATDALCQRLPQPLFFAVMIVPGAVAVGAVGVIVAFVVGRRGTPGRAVGALVVGLLATAPAMLGGLMAAGGLLHVLVDPSVPGCQFSGPFSFG